MMTGSRERKEEPGKGLEPSRPRPQRPAFPSQTPGAQVQISSRVCQWVAPVCVLLDLLFPKSFSKGWFLGSQDSYSDGAQ